MCVGTERCSAVPPAQIVSQKDEHCWVGELNGLRGERALAGKM